MANPDSRAPAAILSTLFVMGAILLAQALILRDGHQARLHKRDVAPMLEKCARMPALEAKR
jgi:hypothetical protein